MCAFGAFKQTWFRVQGTGEWWKMGGAGLDWDILMNVRKNIITGRFGPNLFDAVYFSIGEKGSWDNPLIAEERVYWRDWEKESEEEPVFDEVRGRIFRNLPRDRSDFKFEFVFYYNDGRNTKPQRESMYTVYIILPNYTKRRVLEDLPTRFCRVCDCELGQTRYQWSPESHMYYSGTFCSHKCLELLEATMSDTLARAYLKTGQPAYRLWMSKFLDKPEPGTQVPYCGACGNPFLQDDCVPTCRMCCDSYCSKACANGAGRMLVGKYFEKRLTCTACRNIGIPDSLARDF